MKQLLKIYLMLFAGSTLVLALPGCEPNPDRNGRTTQEDPADDSPPPATANPAVPATATPPAGQASGATQGSASQVSRAEALAQCRTLQSPNREDCERRVNEGFERSGTAPSG